MNQVASRKAAQSFDHRPGTPEAVMKGGPCAYGIRKERAVCWCAVLFEGASISNGSFNSSDGMESTGMTNGNSIGRPWSGEIQSWTNFYGYGLGVCGVECTVFEETARFEGLFQ